MSTTQKKRMPTVDDLTRAQRQFYESLQTDEMREQFLFFLPQVTAENDERERKRKTETLDGHINLVKGVVASLQEYQRNIEKARKDLSSGTSPKGLDLRLLTSPPKLPGAYLHFTKKAKVLAE